MRYAATLLACLFLAGPALATPDLSEVRVDVNEDAQPVRDVLHRLETKHGLNYVVSEQVLAQAGTVTVHLKQVPLDDALQAICAACGLSLQIRGTILVMLPQAATPPPNLPHAEEGLLKKGARREPLPPVAPDPAPPARERPTRRPADDAGRMMVGTVSQVDVKNGRLQLDTGGVKRDLFLPQDSDMQSARLQLALRRMKPGFRVALLYHQDGARAVVTDLIGGDEVREPVVPGRGGPRRRSRELRLDPAPRAKQPQPKDRPAPGSAQGATDGVLVGRLVRREGNQVLIKRGDGTVVSCDLPEDEELRTKVESVLGPLKEGAKLYMTHEKKDGKIVLTGGLSEIR